MASVKRKLEEQIEILSSDPIKNADVISALKNVLFKAEENDFSFSNIKKTYKHQWTFKNLEEASLKNVRSKYCNQVTTKIASIKNETTYCENVMLHCFAEEWFQRENGIHSLAKSNIIIRCLNSYKLELDTFKVVGHKDNGDDTLVGNPRKLTQHLVIVTYNDALEEFCFYGAIFNFDYNKAAKFSNIREYDRDIIIHEDYIHCEEFSKNPVFKNTTNAFLSDKAHTNLNRMVKHFKHENIQQTFDHIVSVYKNKITNDNFKKMFFSYDSPIGTKSRITVNTPKDISTLLQCYGFNSVSMMVLAAFKNLHEF